MKIDGVKLKEAREREGMSLVDVAAIAGFKSSERIRQLEADGGEMNPHVLKAIAKGLKCKLEDLV